MIGALGKAVMVGAARIELATTCSQSRYATAALRPGRWDYRTATAGRIRADRPYPCTPDEACD